MADGTPHSGRKHMTATATNSPMMPDSYRERMKAAHTKPRSSSMGGEYPAMAVHNYVSPLRSLYSHSIYMRDSATKADPGHHVTNSADLVNQMRQSYGLTKSRERTRRPWVVPALAMIHLVAFVLTMSHNNCDRKDDCIFLFGRSFPFQPLTKNPLLGPSAISLLDFGALESDLVEKAGQGWRLITTLSLHAGMFHLAGNLACLLYVGLQLERDFGFFKVVTILYTAGFAGALASSLFVHGRVSVGASGATMGLVGARFAEVVLNWDASSSPHHRTRSLVTTSLLLLIAIVYGLLPLMDNFMHLGGFLAGSLLGNVLLIRPQAHWVKPQQQQPCFPAVMYDVDDFPVTSKHSHYQKVIWIVSLNILVAGFVAALFSHYTGVDARRGCTWCHYMTCLRTDLWKCYGDRNIICDPPTQSSHLQVDCWGYHLAKPNPNVRNMTVQDVFTHCIKRCI